MQNTVKTTPPEKIVALYLGLNYPDEAEIYRWLPMVRICQHEGYWYYSFTEGFAAHYDELKGNVLNPVRGYTQTWKDREIPYWFSNRIPHRADSMEQYDIFGLGDQKGDFIALFARDGGRRNGDYYDIFAELEPQNNKYEYYFPIYELPTLAGIAEKTIAALVNKIRVGHELKLVVTPTKCQIYYQDFYIGHTPPYLRYLLSHNPDCQYRAWVEIVNDDEYRYAEKIVAKIEIRSESSIYNLEPLQTLNPMPK